LDPAAARFRLYQAVAELLLRLAVERPMVLVLDDLHWLDVASLELTRFLATRIGSAAILLVGTYRPEDVPAEHPLTAALGELARLPNATRLGLDGLSEPEVARFMAQKVDVEPHPAVVSAVHHRTDGNPFFVAELAGLLAAEGLLQSRGDIGTRVPPACATSSAGAWPGCPSSPTTCSGPPRSWAGSSILRSPPRWFRSRSRPRSS
jgi:predicted ATPase